MRIRKHAKISPQLFSTSTISSHSLLQTHICQLNQSPWDVISFLPTPSSPPPPPPYQVYGDDSFNGNGSLEDSIGAVESVASMRISSEGIAKVENGEEREDFLGTILCEKSDGKGWKCRKETKEGNTLCNHHLAQLKKYSNFSHPIGKKSDKGGSARQNHRRPRAKKGSTVLSNPHEYYYYSGFGPRWGKKRGPEKSSAEAKNTSTIDKSEEIAEAATTPSSSSTSENGNEFDYVENEDDDDDDDYEMGVNGKKKLRKRIKARSLKSLM